MKIVISQNQEILNEIELTPLQEKSLRILTDNSFDYLTIKIEQILEFIVTEGKKVFSEYEIDTLSKTELEAIATKINADREKAKKEKEKMMGMLL